MRFVASLTATLAFISPFAAAAEAPPAPQPETYLARLAAAHIPADAAAVVVKPLDGNTLA
jgi:hypothetical protein